MKGRHTWKKADGYTALVAALISFAVYVWSAAPNVTLLDSGEFLVAAQHFGVPHPTGYPLWTFLSWIFQMLPLGNAAWEINLFSGVCAALAVGLCAALLGNLQIWCLGGEPPGRLRWIPRIVALAFSLMLAFSQSMWSQAVIAEVYALHALLVACFLVFCYAWVRNPASDRLMYGAFFLLALSFSNHQLTMVLAPLPYLLILLLRPRCFLDWLFAGVLTLLLGYLGFAILSNDQAVLKTAIRFFYCVALAFGVFLWLRRFRIRWRLIAFLPFAVALGLLPHAYMPLASSTNPPMNWGYARDVEGFYFSINRSQYSGSLSDMTVKSLGRLMGVSPSPTTIEPSRKKPEHLSRLQMIQLWVGFFWQKLSAAFTPLALIGYFASIVFVLRLPLPNRALIYFLHLAFVLAAFLQPIAANTKIDNGEWWTQMPYHTYTNLIYALLSGLGMGLLIEKLARKRAAAFWLTPVLLVLPVFTFLGSEPSASQRGRWFGWMYGHDMLKDLPRDSIVIGGTDAGRFVPTYMIFGESPQPPKHKRDPDFDRRDLYIITQNALGEPNYMKYLRDHYTTARPQPANAFERWLGRGNTYPEKPLLLPDQNQIDEALKQAVAAYNGPVPAQEKATLVFSTVLKWIWEHNKDQHEFFIEESFPITWTYDYAIPHGLVYRLNKTKLDTIPPEAVAEDFRFWHDYKTRLLSDPSYRKDLDAQRSFSKLRQTMGNIYRHRKMDNEAERAYREALELWPNSLESILALTDILWARGDFDGAIALFQTALDNDPENIDLWRLFLIAEKRKEIQGEINTLNRRLAEQPRSRETLHKLLELHASVGDTNNARPLVDRAMRDFPEDSDLLRFVIKYHEQNNDYAETLEAAKRLATIESSNLNNHLLLARAYFYQDKKKEFYETANKVAEMGGNPVREAFATEPIFQAWTNDPEFQKLIEIPKLLPQD